MTTAIPIQRQVRTPSVEVRSTFVDKYLMFLCLSLLAYAVDGRGFAYFFLGEAAMVVGFFIVVNQRGWTGVFNSPILLLLVPFWGWGLARTIPFVGTYRMDAIRDAMLWGYSGLAFVVAGLCIAKAERFVTLLRRYRTFAFIFLLTIPVIFIAFRALGKNGPTWPGIGVPIIHEKEGDIMVHLASIFAFWIAGIDSKVSPFWVILLMANAATIGVVDRAGQVAFLAAFAVCAAARPMHPVIVRVIGSSVLVAFALWVTNVHIPIAKGREVSFQQILTNLYSMTGDTGTVTLDDTKEWRVNWWKSIRHYTIGGPYRWTGKGFGVNLAEDDGYQVLLDNSLRSPHNAHMNILARMGVPGIVMWAGMHAAWFAFVGMGYWRARTRNDTRWQAVFLFLFCSCMCFLINAAFDVYLEGPMGAVWFWCVWGMGAAAVYLYKQRPEVLYVT